MFVLKPTPHKACLTFILLFSFLFSLLFWLYYLSPDAHDFVTLSLLFLIILIFSPAIIPLTIVVSYGTACVLSVWLTPFWKGKKLWQPTFSKTIFALLIECSLWVVGWRFILKPLTTLVYAVSPYNPYPPVDPCPAGTAFISLCSDSVTNILDYVVIMIISLVNAGISYTLSCVIAGFIKKMKGRKRI